jgi:hypothetical protein
MTRTLEIRWFWNRVVQCAPGSARNAEDVPTRRPPVPPVAKLSGRVDDRSEAANIAQARRAEPEALVGDRRSRAGPGSETRAHCRIGVKSALANALDPCWMRHAGSDAACFSRLLERFDSRGGRHESSCRHRRVHTLATALRRGQPADQVELDGASLAGGLTPAPGFLLIAPGGCRPRGGG